jgi:hypothetical protein
LPACRPAASATPSRSPTPCACSLAALDAGQAPARPDLALAVRGLAEELAVTVSGSAVELRVPPYTAVQCVEGPRHTRGTPPNVVEADPVAFLLVATGRRPWHDAVADGSVRTSGARADLSPYLPLLP